MPRDESVRRNELITQPAQWLIAPRKEKWRRFAAPSFF
jgi:hypothetical protein